MLLFATEVSVHINKMETKTYSFRLLPWCFGTADTPRIRAAIGDSASTRLCPVLPGLCVLVACVLGWCTGQLGVVIGGNSSLIYGVHTLVCSSVVLHVKLCNPAFAPFLSVDTSTLVVLTLENPAEIALASLS